MSFSYVKQAIENGEDIEPHDLLKYLIEEYEAGELDIFEDETILTILRDVALPDLLEFAEQDNIAQVDDIEIEDWLADMEIIIEDEILETLVIETMLNIDN